MSGEGCSFCVLLWNVNSSKSGSKAKTIQEGMRKVVERIKRRGWENLLIFATDGVNGPKHDILLDELHAEGKERPKEHAEIYFYKRKDTDFVPLTYIGDGYITKFILRHFKRSREDYAQLLKRFTACILTTPEGQYLIVAFHGQNNYKQDALIKFVEIIDLLKRTTGCTQAIVCGDFNMTCEEVKAIMDENFPELMSDVHADYPWPDRKIDFILNWPRSDLRVHETKVEFQRVKAAEIFDHPVIFYDISVTDASDLAQAFGRMQVTGQV